MKKFNKVFIFVWLALVPAKAYSAFEDLGVSARSHGMGDVSVAIADDAYSVYYNPAGLTQLKFPKIGSSYAMLFQGMTDNSSMGKHFVSYAYPMMERGKNTLGIGVSYAGFNVAGLWEESVISGAVAKDLEESMGMPVRVGASVRMLNVKYGDDPYMTTVFDAGTSKSAFGVDVGAMYKVSREMTIGAMLSNVNTPDTGVKWSDPLLMGMKFGGSYKYETFIFAGEVSMPNPETTNISAGGEMWFYQKSIKMAGVRAGVITDNKKKTDITGGASYWLPPMNGMMVGIDYALIYPLETAKNTMTHWISLQVAFGVEKMEPVQRTVTITAIAKPEMISPDGNGIGDKTTIALSSGVFRDVSSWQIQIKKDKTAVKMIKGTYTIPESAAWDGKDDKDSVVSDGSYVYTFTVIDGAGSEETTGERTIIVDTKPPIAKIALSSPVFSPDGDGIDDKIMFSLQASDDIGVDNWIYKISDSQNKDVKKYNGKAAPPEIEWDGTDDANKPITTGKYNCDLIVFDTAGNKSSSTIVLEAVTSKPVPPPVVKEAVKEPLGAETPKVKGVDLIDSPEGGIIRFPYYKLFDAKGKVKPEAYEILDLVVKSIEDNPTRKVRIEGHTDTSSTNKMLELKTSEIRAKSIYNFLVMRGIPAERLSYIGIGPMKPLILEEKTASDRAQNRRIEIIILK